MLLRKGVVKTCSKFAGEHPCRSAISIKFRTPFLKNTSGRLHLKATLKDILLKREAIKTIALIKKKIQNS